jgi:peptidoglycan/LPS O-acetylase OafA/YrhL
MQQQRFIALDNLRGICAIMVAIYHFSTVSYLAGIPFIKNGFLFVDFFFVLSGLVIASSYGWRLRTGFSISRFMFLRLGRLYPLHIFVLCLYLPIALGGGYSAVNFWKTALLLQVFSDGQLGNWNPPSWSISAEVWTYLIFALLCQFSGRFLPWVLGALIVAAPPILLWTSDRYLDVCFEGALLRCLFGFSMGALAFMYWNGRDRLSLSAKAFTLIELIAVAASLLIVSIAGAGPLSFLCPPVFVVTILVFAHEGGAISSVLTSRVLKTIGALSYSIYMTHLFVQARLLNLIGALSKHFWLPFSKEVGGAQTISSDVPFAADAVIVLMIAIIVGFAYLTFNLIEEPFRRWSRGALAAPHGDVARGASNSSVG